MNILFVVLLAGFLLVVVSSIIGKGKFGINFQKVICPKCGSPVPTARKPANLQQALWGGWTCQQCSTEIDKWGNQINP